FGVADSEEITEEEFRQRLPYAEPEPAVPGALVVIFAEIELTNGERTFLQVQVPRESMTAGDMGVLLQHILTPPSLHARRLGGGAIILNPAQILRVAFHPGPPETPPNAWAADPIAR